MDIYPQSPPRAYSFDEDEEKEKTEETEKSEWTTPSGTPPSYIPPRRKFPFSRSAVLSVILVVFVAVLFFNWGAKAEYGRYETFLLQQCSQGINTACELLK